MRVFGKPHFAEPGKMTRNMKRVGLERKGIVGKERLDNLGMVGLGGSLDSPLQAGTFAVEAVEIVAEVVVVD